MPGGINVPIYKPCGPSDEDRSGKDEYNDFVEKENHKGVIIAMMVIDVLVCFRGGCWLGCTQACLWA